MESISPRIVHDSAQVSQMGEICKEIFSQCVSNTLPAMVVSLACRQKYVAQKVPNDGFFARTIVTRGLLQKVLDFQRQDPYRLKMKSSSFEENDSHVQIPQEALAVYLTFNPKSQLAVLEELSHQIIQQSLFQGVDFKQGLNIQNEFVTAFQRSKQPLIKFMELDIDTKDPKILRVLHEDCSSLLSSVFFIIETHGGFHIVYLQGKDMQEFYRALQQDAKRESKKYHFSGTSRDGQTIIKKHFEVRSDPCFPVPGTLQGNFPVRFVDVVTFRKLLQD